MGAALDSISMNKKHKFFDITLDNDLESLKKYLSEIESKIFTENILSVPNDILRRYDKNQPGTLTQLGINYYNVFTFVNPEIFKLKEALRKITIEACEYYGIDFNSQKYLIHGWFNSDFKTLGNTDVNGVNPLKHPSHFHDHSDGLGAPWFHGYYCVDAEPSSTFYKINNDNDNIFENINKNNRAILSETGHPHGRDDWFFDNKRITIAYDITPMSHLLGVKPNKWMPL